MHDRTETPPTLSRRRMLGVIAAAPVAGVVVGACSGDGGAADTAATSTTTPSSTNPATGQTSTTVAAQASTTSQATTSGGWASCGTDLISVAYPDDTIFEAASTCSVSLTPGTTEGPCYFHSDTEEDISTGKTGLPMQLCIKLVDTDCAPLPNHVVEAWHCDTRGIYSGDISSSSDSSSFAGDFCTAGDDEAESSTYFRGQRTTDENGRVNFKTCFPGWYSGRTIHIHFAVSEPEGTTRVISQWCFTDEFAEEICTTHDLYSDRGVQDTPLSDGSDTVFPSTDYETFMLDVQPNPDGTLLAYGIVQIDPTAIASQTGFAGDDGNPGRGRPGDDRDRPEPPGDS